MKLLKLEIKTMGQVQVEWFYRFLPIPDLGKIIIKAIYKTLKNAFIKYWK